MTKSKTKIVLCVLLYPLLFWSIWAAWKDIESIDHEPHSVTMTPMYRGESLSGPTVEQKQPTSVDKGAQPTAAVGRKTIDARDLSAEQRAELAKELDAAPKLEGYRSLSFKFLAGFECGLDETGNVIPVPDRILALDKTKVGVSGFMVPMELKGDKVSRFILLRNQLLCCYGEEPKANEWIYIGFDEPVPFIADKPVAVFGVLESSPDVVEGQLLSLYTMNGNVLRVLD